MKVVKESTSLGKQLIERGSRYEGIELHQIYDKWSDAKQKAFDRCWEQYVNDNQSTAFGVGNANTYGFTCSWLAIKDGENILRIETKNNSYIVWLDR